MKTLRSFIRDALEAPAASRASGDKWLREAAEKAPSGERILAVCQGLAAFLIEKNVAYGDSAVNPLRIFSKASPTEQILVRLDDKISRMRRGSSAGEDVIGDLLGYLVLFYVTTATSEP